MGDQQGFYGKYMVRKATTTAAGTRTGPPLTDVFVLRPEKDSAALEVLGLYARLTSNLELAADLRAWIRRIKEDKYKSRCPQNYWEPGMGPCVCEGKVHGENNDESARFLQEDAEQDADIIEDDGAVFALTGDNDD